MKTNKLKLLSTALLLSFSLSACQENTNSNTSASTVSNTKTSETQKAVYQVYSEQNYIPFIMHDGKGTVTGFEHDLLQAIAEKENIEFKFVAHTWEDLFNVLQNKKADVITSGITITEERKQTMDFIEPHLETETVILTKDNAIQSFNDMKGKKVSVQEGTLQGSIAEKHQHGQGEILLDKTNWSSIKRLLNKEADIVLGDKVVMNYYQAQYANEKFIVVKNKSSEKELLAFAVHKDNIDLKNKLNNGLKKIKEDGTYKTIHNKWFGANE